jgi:hypothetical protein
VKGRWGYRVNGTDLNGFEIMSPGSRKNIAAAPPGSARNGTPIKDDGGGLDGDDHRAADDDVGQLRSPMEKIYRCRTNTPGQSGSFDRREDDGAGK